ncbi:MAG: extracellular solute-binding protein [Xenococcaceae cyanobacterium]
MNLEKMYQGFCGILLLAIAVLLAACSSSQSETEEQLQGRLLLWHFFEGKEAEVLNDILDKYTELYPKVKIVSEYVRAADISEQFIQQTQSGLGPDLMIVRYRDLDNLIRAGTLRELNDYNLDLSIYLPVAINHVSFQNKLYALPFALKTQVLCYNTKKVSQPPKTLSALLKEARSGRRVGLTSDFMAIFWGVQIFGGKPFDVKGRATLDQGGLTEWLEWLKQANTEPNFILHGDRLSLHQAFAEEELAYYVCNSDEISALKAALGEEKLGVTLLPSEAGRSAGPIITTRALVFNQASSPAGMELALQLVQFLTNVQQQTQLALDTESQIPVNKQVKIDWRLSPIQAVLLAQSKTSVAIPLDYDYIAESIAREYGTLLYNRVLEGEMKPNEAAAEMTQKINRALGWD